MDIKYYYENSELTIQQIADKTNNSFNVVFKYIAKHYSVEHRKQRKSICYRNSKLGDKNPMLHKTGNLCPHYKGIVSDNKGYWMSQKPDWYTGRKGSKHVFVHHLVICQAMGLTEIKKGWTVHHCDFNTANNEFSNLVLILLSDHMRLHQSVLKGATTISKESTLKWVEAHGTPWYKVL